LPFFLPAASPTAVFTLSLHDALPILGLVGAGGPLHLGLEAEGAQLAQQVVPHAVVLRRSHRMRRAGDLLDVAEGAPRGELAGRRSEEHTSELQSLTNILCRLLLAKKN